MAASAPQIAGKSESEVNDLLKKYMPNRKAEMDKFGEVFTPPELINSIYSRINEYSPSIWKNPKTTLLDPSAGVGNFIALAYTRFMKGLASKIPDPVKRSNHIIENMLFMVELNPANCKVIRKLFGKKANVICSSFLDECLQKVNPSVVKKFLNKREGFTIIVGNPPYQQERPETEGTNAGRKTLWDKFITSSFDILEPKGYLGFINPAGWRGTGRSSYLWKFLTEKQILYLRIYSQQDGNKIFNATTRFDVYIVQNQPNSKPTEVIDQNGETHYLDLSAWPFLPNYLLPLFRSIIVPPERGIRVLYGTHHHTQKPNVAAKQSRTHNHKVVHNINQDGLGYWYANSPNSGHIGAPKVILNFNQKQYNFPEQNDFRGQLGMSQLSFGIPIKTKEEGEEVLRAVGLPLFQELIKASKWGAFQTDHRMFNYFTPNLWKMINRSSKGIKQKTRRSKSGAKSGYQRKGTKPSKTRRVK